MILVLGLPYPNILLTLVSFPSSVDALLSFWRAFTTLSMADLASDSVIFFCFVAVVVEHV
jgi:hypothetical protein